jgi:hypothetical protein
MTKVVYAPLKSSKTKRSRSVATKQVRSPDGQPLTIRTVDADSRTFGDDLSYVFRQNVKRARQENKRLGRSANRVVSKD